VWRRAALAASIGIFIFAFDGFPCFANWVEPAAESGFAAPFSSINVNDCPDTIEGSFLEKDPHDLVIVFNKGTIEWDQFPLPACQLKIKLLGKGESPVSRNLLIRVQNNFGASDLNNGAGRIAFVMSDAYDINRVIRCFWEPIENLEPSNDDLRSVRSVEFIPSKIDEFARQLRLSSSDTSKDNCESRNKNSCNGGQEAVVSISDADDPKKNVWAEMVLGALFCACVLVWGTYFVFGREGE